MKIAAAILLGVAAVWLGALLYGSYRWDRGTRALRGRLEAARMPVEPRRVDFRELDGLPAPVQQYFRTVLREGQPMIAAVDVRHAGTFNMGETEDRWRSFKSHQRVVLQRPGFDWNARMALLPGISVRVHDAYVAGEGILHAAALGLIPVVNLRGGGDLAEGELMRFLAEATWYPTALLPSQGVRWEEVDDSSARATLADGAASVTLLFMFNDDGLVERVRADARGRTVDGVTVPTPWEGRFWNYAERDGIRIPLDGEVVWLFADGEKPYWRGRISEVTYET